jgi:two-component system chemotaxis response regulator CheY
MKTIVVVDDNLMMREFLHQLLFKHYEVITFENGTEAMAYIESNNQPDVMLLDYEMEGMNGHEILETIKSSGFFKDIPVILLSGKKTSETRIACLKSGAKDFISKPFNPAELKLRIENAMN